MTRELFTSDPSACKRLNDVLNDPLIQMAFAIALREVQPSVPSPLKGDLIQQAAIGGMVVTGANAFVASLRSLTNPARTKSEGTGDYDQVALESLKKSGYSEEEAKKALREYHLNQQ